MNKPVIIPSKTNNKNMERYLQKKLSEAAEGGTQNIKYTEQSLTAEQQAQVRENIGAGDAETVQELDEKVNGSMVTKWTVLEAESTITGKGLRSLSTSSTTSIFDKTNFSVAIFRVANGNTVRITAKKPAGSSFGPNPSDFFAYSSSSQATSFDRVASGEAKESTSSGTITNFEFLCSSDGYLAVVGDSSTPPKCEVLNNEHVPGLEERVTDLEQKVGEDTLNAITYDEQNLTEEQQAQARENIDVPSTGQMTSALGTKQDAISDLSTIREWAKKANVAIMQVPAGAETVEQVPRHYVSTNNGSVITASGYVASSYSFCELNVNVGHYYFIEGRRPTNSQNLGISGPLGSGNGYEKMIDPSTGEEYNSYAVPDIDASGKTGAFFLVPGDNEGTRLITFTARYSSSQTTTIKVYDLGDTPQTEPRFGDVVYVIDVGRLGDLETTEKGTVIGALNEVVNNVSGKENTTNKVQTITGNESNQTKYPSTKAVYDEVHPAVASSQPQGGFLPNVFYNLGALTGSVTFALATPADATIVNHYYWTFETGSTAPTITWPNGITWLGGSAPEISASKHYEISVLNGIGTFMEV